MRLQPARPLHSNLYFDEPPTPENARSDYSDVCRASAIHHAITVATGGRPKGRSRTQRPTTGIQPDALPDELSQQALSIGRSKVYELIMAGELDSVRIGGCRRIPRRALITFAEALVDEPPSEVAPSS
jgi:excisionase family DNA binding protein